MNQAIPGATPATRSWARRTPRCSRATQGWTTFARLPRLSDVARADVVVVGVPFDSAVTYRPGADSAPTRFVKDPASSVATTPNSTSNRSRFCQFADAGDIACNPFDIGEAVDQIAAQLTELQAEGTRAVILGGDHSVALPSLRAVHAVHGPVALVHFDAHLDTWDSYYEADITHGSPFRRAFEEGLLLDRSLHRRGARIHL